MKKIFFFILFLTSVLILCSPVHSSSKKVSAFSEDFSPQNISSFIKHLVNDGEYYRAHTELSRLVCYYPEYLSPLCYSVTDSFILFKSARYQDILNVNIISEDANSLCALNIFKIDSLMKSGVINNGQIDTFLSINNCSDAFFAEYYEKRKHYYSILDNFNNYSRFSQPETMKYHEFYDYATNLSKEKKSPLLGALSGIIPGMGYVYAGEPGTGIVALIVIAAGSAVTWGAHVNNVEPLAAVSGAATFFMYAGSIVGGYMETVKFNNRLLEKLVVRLDRDFMLDKDREDIYIKFGIESNVR